VLLVCCGGVLGHWTTGRGFDSRPFHFHAMTLGKLFVHTHVPLSPSRLGIATYRLSCLEKGEKAYAVLWSTVIHLHIVLLVIDEFDCCSVSWQYLHCSVMKKPKEKWQSGVRGRVMCKYPYFLDLPSNTAYLWPWLRVAPIQKPDAICPGVLA